jgi:hypothetical protein
MGLFDFIQRNRNLKEQMPNIDEKPQIVVFQYDDNGNVDYTKTLNARQNSTPRSLKEHLFGRTMSIDEQTINPNTKKTELVTHTNFKPGFLNNFDAGLNENYYNDFAINNLMPNQNKSLATRFGEGLGSIAKILGTVGGDAYVAGTEGLDAAMKRQSYRTGDQLYRNALEAQNIDTSNIKGFVAPETFNRLIQAKQLQDNAKFRELYYKNQEQNQKDMMDFRQRQLEYQQRQDAVENALKSRGLDIQENKITNGINKLSSKDLSTYKDNLATLEDINAGLNLIDKNPNAYSLVKGALPAWATNRLDPQGIATRTQIDNITAVYRKWLTGAQMSDAERKAYERFLPAPTDNYETIKAKLEGMRDTIERKNKILLGGINNYQNEENVKVNEGWAF